MAMIIVFCEECGKKHAIDSERIKTQAAKFRCISCGNMIVVEKRDWKSGTPACEKSPAGSGHGETEGD